MAYTPQTLADLRVALGRWAGKELKWYSVARSCQQGKNYYGWHLGKDQIYGRVTNKAGFTCVGMGARDPSVQHQRDKAGLSNARSAIDIHQAGVGGNAALRKLTAWLVAEAKAGRAPDIADILGPGADGRAYYWAATNAWKPVQLAKGNSHEWHDHISYRRDSENRDKRPLFARYFAPPPPPPPPPEEPLVSPEDVKKLQQALNDLGWRPVLKVDGIHGALTRAAVAGVAAHVRKAGSDQVASTKVGALALVRGARADIMAAAAAAAEATTARLDRLDQDLTK